MTRIAEHDVVARLAAHRVVPVVVVDDAAQAAPLAAALVKGRLPIAEITLRTPAGIEAIRRIADRGDVLVGAGTVLTPVQVDRCVAAGAQFVVSPGTSRAVIERCGEHGVLALPGTATASEVMTALALGVHVVKFFPAATSGGVDGVTALAAPFGDVRFVPTGGIGASDAADYLRVPAVLAVGGSWMVPRDRLKAGDVAQVAELCAAAARLGGGIGAAERVGGEAEPSR